MSSLSWKLGWSGKGGRNPGLSASIPLIRDTRDDFKRSSLNRIDQNNYIIIDLYNK